MPLDSRIHLILQYGLAVDTNQQHPNPYRVAVSRVPLFSEFRADADQLSPCEDRVGRSKLLTESLSILEIAYRDLFEYLG
jgi:hypothetical protein